MIAGTPPPTPEPGRPHSGRSRDAAHTRRLLLDAAHSRFARDGYSATTVRDIAADAGVNVALISRYFASKEGLFEACLVRAAQELGDAEGLDVTFEEILASVVQSAINSHTGDGQTHQLLLLLRTSGDERTDTLRRRTLQSFAERIATAAGWNAAEEDVHNLLSRAQITLATALGIVQLRSTGLEPLASATAEQLSIPLRDVLGALLSEEPTAQR